MTDILEELKNLGINPSSNFEETKVAFKKLFRKFHPDVSNLPEEEAERSFIKAREEYNSFLKLGVTSLFTPKEKTKPEFSKEEILRVLNDYIKTLIKEAKKIRNHESIFSESLPFLMEICQKLNLDFREVLKPIFEAIYLAQLEYLYQVIKQDLNQINRQMGLFNGLFFLGQFLKRNIKKDFKEIGIAILSIQLKSIVKIKNKSVQNKQLELISELVQSFDLNNDEIMQLIKTALK